MRWPARVALRFRSLLRRKAVDDELDAELRFHLDREIAANIATGMTPAEARAAVLRTFGGLEGLKEECRDERRVAWVQDFVQDARYGLRMLRKSPGFTAVAAFTLALGIGANSAIFSVVDGVVLRALPYPAPERLVQFTDAYPPGAIVAMRETLKTAEVAAYRDDSEFNLTGRGLPIRLYGASVMANFFSVLRAKPAIGRTFLPGEDQPGKDAVVILSYGLWQSEFGGDPAMIGRSVMLEGIDRRIVGVMPREFRYPAAKTQLWAPLHLDPREVGPYWGGPFMPVFGRLRPGATLEQARAELRAAVPRLRAQFPWRMPDALWSASTVISLQNGIAGDVRGTLFILLGAIGLVLLIACANVANLLLARAAARQREMAVRAALGARRGRIHRQLLTESLILASTGGALGLLLAAVGIGWLKALLPANTPRLTSVSIDWRVLGFTAAIAIATGVVFGLAPALYASAAELTGSLKTGQRQAGAAASDRLRSALVIAEIAVAVVLVIGAGLMVKSLWELSRVNPGFSPESIVTARITPNDSFCKPPARCEDFYRQLISRVRGLPGVKDAALVNVLPLGSRFGGFAADLEGHPRNPRDPAFMLWESVITPGYLRVMGIPVLRGRGFTPADSAPGAPAVTLVTASTAKKFWPNEDPIGKHLKRSWTNDWITVVGVVGDVYEASLTSRVPSYFDGAVYDPYGNNSGSGGAYLPVEMSVVALVAGRQSDFAGMLGRAVANLSPEAPVSEVEALPAVVAQSLSAPRSTTRLFAIFAALALALGAVGIYGVVSYSAAQRTAEIGLRMALGAESRDVFGLVMGHGARLAGAGVGIGIAGALAATRLMASELYGVTATDPQTFAAVAILLAGVALAACYIPARRAARVDPMLALRYE